MHNFTDYILYFIIIIIIAPILGLMLNLRFEEVIAMSIICALIELISNFFDDNDKHKPRMA